MSAYPPDPKVQAEAERLAEDLDRDLGEVADMLAEAGHFGPDGEPYPLRTILNLLPAALRRRRAERSRDKTREAAEATDTYVEEHGVPFGDLRAVALPTDGLSLHAEQIARFERIAYVVGSDAAQLLKRMVLRVLEIDDDLRRYGLPGVGLWASDRDPEGAAASEAVRGLPADVQPTSFMWPSDVPFPWSAEECKAAILGYQVRWKGDIEDFWTRLRGDWEMIDGYAYLRQR